MVEKWIIEYRQSRKADWHELVEGLRLTDDEADEFFADLEREDDGLYRRRLLPEYGYDTRMFSWAPPGGWRDEGPLVLSRDMPASVHRLNDELLTALGV